MWTRRRETPTRRRLEHLWKIHEHNDYICTFETRTMNYHLTNLEATLMSSTAVIYVVETHFAYQALELVYTEKKHSVGGFLCQFLGSNSICLCIHYKLTRGGGGGKIPRYDTRAGLSRAMSLGR